MSLRIRPIDTLYFFMLSRFKGVAVDGVWIDEWIY
jgi:hypothetical protein